MMHQRLLICGGLLLCLFWLSCKPRKAADHIVSFAQNDTLRRIEVEDGELDTFLLHRTEYTGLKVLFIDQALDCEHLLAISEISSLEYLCFRSNSCMQWPMEFARLSQLKTLIGELAVNAENLPTVLFEMPNIERLELHSMALRKVPRELTKLKKLSSLELSETIVRSIDDSVATMPSLRKVYLPGVNVADTVKAHLLRLNPKLEVYIN